MQVTVVGRPDVPAETCERVTTDIGLALSAIRTVGQKFIVNDTTWYRARRRGGVAPVVVNSATYMSETFQAALAQLPGWSGETEIAGQKIDGFGEFLIPSVGYHLPRDRTFRFLQELSERHTPVDADLGVLATRIYGMYVQRSLFGVDRIPTEVREHFSPSSAVGRIRIGVEFETGNIASSFRALTKLENLFRSGEIDAGVFVTSIDKANSAARIWPTSNRNGSFQELRNRKYRDNLAVPLWEFGFAPDEFDASVGYLGANRRLYEPVATGEHTVIGGRRFEIYRGEAGEELLRPSDVAPQ